MTAIVTTRDRPALLADALASVERQSRPPLEIRVADDGVPPLATLPDVALLQVTVVHSAAGRVAVARNRAAEGSRGEVLAFLDDDDRWRPEHLAGLAAAFADPAVGFAWRDCAVIRERVEADGRRTDLERIEIARDWDPAMMRDNDYLPPSGWGVRRSLFEKLAGFDESFAFSEDWDFVLRAAALVTPRRVPGVTVEVRMREHGNASANFGPERIDCLRRLATRHGLPALEPRTFWEVARHAAGPPPSGPRRTRLRRVPRGAGQAPNLSDLAIVGAGFAGMTAALAARGAGLGVVLLERAAEPGGQLRRIHSPLTGAGGGGGDAAAVAADLQARLAAAGQAVRGAHEVVELRAGAGGPPALGLAGGERLAARAVLVATGLRARTLGVPGEGELGGRGVSTSATRDRAAFAGQPVVVVGGGDAAFENALLLAQVGCGVTLLVRGEPRARAGFRRRVAAEPAIALLERTRLTAILGGARVTGVRVEGPAGSRTLETSGVFVKVGSVPNTEWCRPALDGDADGYLRVDERGRTSAPGVWAAGDVIRPAALTLEQAEASVARAVTGILAARGT